MDDYKNLLRQGTRLHESQSLRPQAFFAEPRRSPRFCPCRDNEARNIAYLHASYRKAIRCRLSVKTSHSRRRRWRRVLRSWVRLTCFPLNLEAADALDLLGFGGRRGEDGVVLIAVLALFGGV